MHSDLLFSLVLRGNRTKVRRKIMNCKLTGAAGLVGAFVAGMLVATAFAGGMATAGAKAPKAEARGRGGGGQRGVNPRITGEDITLLRGELWGKKKRVSRPDRPPFEPQGDKYDQRSAIVFADPVGACEGVGRKKYQRSETRYLETKRGAYRLFHDVPPRNNPSGRLAGLT